MRELIERAKGYSNNCLEFKDMISDEQIDNFVNTLWGDLHNKDKWLLWDEMINILNDGLGDEKSHIIMQTLLATDDDKVKELNFSHTKSEEYYIHYYKPFGIIHPIVDIQIIIEDSDLIGITSYEPNMIGNYCYRLSLLCYNPHKLNRKQISEQICALLSSINNMHNHHNFFFALNPYASLLPKKYHDADITTLCLDMMDSVQFNNDIINSLQMDNEDEICSKKKRLNTYIQNMYDLLTKFKIYRDYINETYQ